MQTAMILSLKMFSRKILKSSLIVAFCFCFFTTFQSMYNSKFIIYKPFRKTKSQSKSMPTPPQRKIVDGSEEKCVNTKKICVIRLSFKHLVIKRKPYTYHSGLKILRKSNYTQYANIKMELANNLYRFYRYRYTMSKKLKMGLLRWTFNLFNIKSSIFFFLICANYTKQFINQTCSKF